MHPRAAREQRGSDGLGQASLRDICETELGLSRVASHRKLTIIQVFGTMPEWKSYMILLRCSGPGLPSK